MIPMERMHEYRAVYHVLGGALSPIDGVEPEDLRIAELYVPPQAPELDTVAGGRARDQPDDHR